jgi:Mg-chelatase subunit ChlD
VIAAARAIAARLAVARPPQHLSKRRGGGELRSVRYSGAADEIDFDRTLEAIAERRPLSAEDVTVRERRRQKRAVVLAVDVSGSMRGDRIRTAAATVGALTAELARDDLAVIAFWSDAAMLLRLGERASLEGLIDDLLEIEPTGLTNVSFPLEVAERELRRMPDHRRRVLLLSDCVHNAGRDPVAVAARLPRLDVLLDTSGEQDPELARDLARRGRGTVASVAGYRDVAPALGRILGSPAD